MNNISNTTGNKLFLNDAFKSVVFFSVLLLVGLFSRTLYGVSGNSDSSKVKDDYIFYNGVILPMDKLNYQEKNNPQAIRVKNGIVVEVGNKSDIFVNKDKETVSVDLKGKTLMPGFIEPHLHMTLMIDFSAVTDLSPCLPERYAYQLYDDDGIFCPVTLADTWKKLNESRKREIKPENKLKYRWIIANGIDPSRLGNANLKQLKSFIESPAKVIEKEVNGGIDQPVFLLDQSGHVGYVNMQAFVTAGICQSKINCGVNYLQPGITLPQQANPPIGHWEVDANGMFTGKLLESPAFLKFVSAIKDNLDIPSNSPFFFLDAQQGLEKAPEIIDKIAQTGVTTIINGGGMTVSEVDFIKSLSQLANSKLRYRSLISADILADPSVSQSSFEIAESLKTPIWEDSDKGLFGAYGIKIWADGSTQGCSANLKSEYSSQGLCEGVKSGQGANYTLEEMTKVLTPYWTNQWLVQVHANGDSAMEMTLSAFRNLQKRCASVLFKPNKQPLTLIHATVGGNPEKNENVIKKVAELNQLSIACKRKGDGSLIVYQGNLDISVSHLSGHVAYWGGAFESILDGKGQIEPDTGKPQPDNGLRASMLDPAATDIKMKVPFSLHSDAPITPVNPLWYAEQLINRNTWFYPKLADKDAYPMPISDFGDQKIDVYQALRGITINPARQNNLQHYIGSIEKGKIADLVILNQNPMSLTDTNQLHKIKVISTFVNGIRHDW